MATALLLLVLMSVTSGFLLNDPDVHLYISPTGSDTNDGLHVSRPLQTLHHAVSLLSSGQMSGKNVFFELLAGHHVLPSTLNIAHKDSQVVTFTSYKGAAAYVTGGKRIESNFFKPVTDQQILKRLPITARSHVRVVHLPDAGVTDYGSITPYGYYADRTAQLEVFVNTQPMRLARWPNEGFVNIDSMPDGNTGKRFTFSGHAPRNWDAEQEPWAYGYWYWSWSDRAVKIVHINSTSREVTLIKNPVYGFRKGHWPKGGYGEQGGYCRFFNLLAELDQPGEYYIDKQAGDLYVWLPTRNGNVDQSDTVYVSMVNNCVTLGTGSRNIVFQDFTLEACRAIGISGNSVSNISVLNMEIRNTGGFSLKFPGDSRSVVVSQSFLHDGDGGVFLAGGDRQHLIPSGNVVADNEIWRFSREGAVGYDAVRMFGVGVLVHYNHMHIGQYTAIRYSGNDHRMEHNHIHHTCMNASDCGAVHTGRDWTTLGNLIRFNSIHHTLRLVPGADVRGVMLDDQASGAHIEFNVFYQNEVHVNIGGGRYNVIRNNVMFNATKYAMQAVPYNGTLWLSRYPELISFDSQNKSLPEGNVIATNVFYTAGRPETVHGLSRSLFHLFNISQNTWVMCPSAFRDPANGDFRARGSLAQWEGRVGFTHTLPPDHVGPRYPVGPPYSRRDAPATPTSVTPAPCTTQAPTTAAPMPAYLPDGSRPNTLYNVSNEGCWLVVSGCSGDPAAVGTYRDTYGEQHAHAADDEKSCFRRAVGKWQHCGSHAGEQVTAVYGPTGAMTIAGDGCFFAMYGCPKHSGPADGHVVAGRISRDTYAEQHNGAHNEAVCLSRAHAQWAWCGSNPNHTVTSLFRPTGKFLTAGAGCWIHVLKCPADPQPASMFYDSWGAANMGTDREQLACFSRAAYYWYHCGSHKQYPVTAHYRPAAVSLTVP